MIIFKKENNPNKFFQEKETLSQLANKFETDKVNKCMLKIMNL